jgi:hypothetical protein
MKMTACDTNDWFRHEHIPGEPASPRIVPLATLGRKHTTSPIAGESKNTPLWAGKSDSVEDAVDVRQTVSSPEASEYLKRNITGTTSEWFPHEHPADSRGNDQTVTTPRHKGGKECAENAIRMQGESPPSWFSHDPIQNYTEPSHPKLTSPEARLLKEKAKGDEMRQVFRMDQNLKTTWVVPPSSSCHGMPDVESLKVNDVTKNNQALMDKFISNQKIPNGDSGSNSVAPTVQNEKTVVGAK